METKMTDMLSKSALLEQCAEECAELGQACLKLARKCRNENPTPKSEDEILENLVEEIADVTLCNGLLIDKCQISTKKIEEIAVKKMERWKGRLIDHYESLKPESCEECLFKNAKKRNV